MVSVCFCKVWKVDSGSFSKGVRGSPKQLLCSVLCWQSKPDSISLPVRQKPMLAGSQEGINYILTDSQFWLQTQWVQHKQTLVSIHSRRWIKQHQSLSTPLISPLSQLLYFAQNLLTAFIVQFNIWDKKMHPISFSQRSYCHKTFNYHLTFSLSLMNKYIMHHCNVRHFLSE